MIKKLNTIIHCMHKIQWCLYLYIWLHVWLHLLDWLYMLARCDVHFSECILFVSIYLIIRYDCVTMCWQKACRSDLTMWGLIRFNMYHWIICAFWHGRLVYNRSQPYLVAVVSDCFLFFKHLLFIYFFCMLN